ncbi:MAG: HAD family hydrolase [Ruminococcus sp.]|nr:HAD family hydrolase [Ruminococcus sp.]MDE6788981.1 HAD family hydrolase [Ruminococcus sp.]
MIVSFDLDETLFVNLEKVPTEKPLKFPLNKIYRDRLRAGAVDLLTWINKSDIQLWIYTTSYRSLRYISGIFRHYGIRIDNIINGKRHAEEVQGSKKEIMPSKYPAKYHIDLHVDDEISVYQNGIAHGFRVYLLKENDTEWTDKIKAEIIRIKKIINI